MTQALNLGLLGNNVNTSGQVSLTAGVSGTLPMANGGLGTTTLTANNVLLGNGGSSPQVVAPGTSGNVLTSNGSTWTSAAAPAPSTANVLNATASASLGAVGTYAFLASPTNTNLVMNPGTTVAGSSVRYAGGLSFGGGLVTSQVSATAPAGTWRAMGYARAVFACCSNFTYGSLFLRIS